MSAATIRKPEAIANWLFYYLSSWRSLVGLLAIAVLTAISVTFNYQLGKMMGSDQITRELFPVGFATLDLAALFLASWITRKSDSLIRKIIAWFWFFYLLSLSVWAAMSFTLASDARLAQSGYEMMKDAKIRALEQAEEQVIMAQENYAETSRYKKLRMAELREAQSIRDALIGDVQRLNNATPHVSMAIYYRVSALLHNHWGIDIDPKDLSSVVRMLWSLALTLSPFILTGLLAFEIGSTPTTGWKKVSPRENDNLNGNKRTNLNSSPEMVPIRDGNSESPRNTGKVEEKPVALDREALAKVREWLRGEEGRVTREQIKYRSGRKVYAHVSLIIEALLNEGWLVRMSNGQLKASKPRLRAVS